jgi:hypothetical protein
MKCQRKGCNKPALFPTKRAQCQEHHDEHIESGRFLTTFEWKKPKKRVIAKAIKQ